MTVRRNLARQMHQSDDPKIHPDQHNYATGKIGCAGPTRQSRLSLTPKINKAHLVAVEITDIGAVDIRAVLRPGTGVAFIACPIGQGRSMDRIDLVFTRTQQTDRIAIAGCGGSWRAHLKGPQPV